MAPNVSLYFYAANDLNGDPLHVITDEDDYFKGVLLKPRLYGLGGMEMVLARLVGFAGFSDGTFETDVLVRALVHAYSDTEFFTGCLLQKRLQTVVHKDESGAEEFHFGGPGPKEYIRRARTLPESNTGTGWNLDLENGVWRWNENASWLRVFNRLLLEDAASDAPALPDLTKGFTNTDDSASDPADDITEPGQYEIPIGQDFLTALWDLEDAGAGVSTIYLGTVAAPEFRLDLWNSYGVDASSSTFGAGKVLLKEGVNIVDDSLVLDGIGLRKYRGVVVEGKDGTWVSVVAPSWDPGEYMKWGKIEYPRSSRVATLEAAGLRWIRRQENLDKGMTVSILPGHTDAAGLYFPGKSGLLLGNSISVDTSADGSTHTPLDLQPSELQLLSGFDMEMLKASRTDDALAAERSWSVKVILNGERGGEAGAPDQKSAASGTVGHGIGLCPPGEASVEVETSTAWKRTALDSVPAGWEDVGFDDSAYSAAVHVTDAGWVDPSSSRWIWGTANSVGVVGFRREFTLTEQPLRGLLTLAADASCDVYVNGELVASHTGFAATADYAVGGSKFVVGLNCIAIIGTNTAAAGTNPGGVYGLLEVATADTALNGSEACAAHGDHLHLVESLLTEETDTGLVLKPDGTGGVEFGTGGGYTDEQAQDAIGAMLADTATINFTYTDATPELKADVIPGGIKLDDLGTPDDNTDLNASSAVHGLLPKLDNTGLKFLRDDGTWQPLTSVAETALGFLAFALPLGVSWADGVASYTAASLPANGGSRAFTVEITAPMLLDTVLLRCTDTASARSVRVDVYYQATSGTTDGTRVASGTLSFTAGAAATRAIPITGAPVLLAPGLYWIVFQNTHATNTLGIGVKAGGTIFGPNNVGQLKTTTNPNGATLDLSTGWTRVTSMAGFMLQGRVFNEGAPF